MGATVAAAVQTKAVATISEGFENVSYDTACGSMRWYKGTDGRHHQMGSKGTILIRGSCSGPGSSREIAEAVAMQEAAEHYSHRCLDVGLEQLQWWLEEETIEAEGHLRADYVWQIIREARL